MQKPLDQHKEFRSDSFLGKRLRTGAEKEMINPKKRYLRHFESASTCMGTETSDEEVLCPSSDLLHLKTDTQQDSFILEDSESQAANEEEKQLSEINPVQCSESVPPLG